MISFGSPLPGGDRGSCPAGWNGNLALCTGNAAAFVQNLATNSSPGAPCNFSAGRAITANSVQVLCPASNPGGGPLYNINSVAISLLQLKLPNGQYLVPSSGTGGFSTGRPGAAVHVPEPRDFLSIAAQSSRTRLVSRQASKALGNARRRWSGKLCSVNRSIHLQFAQLNGGSTVRPCYGPAKGHLDSRNLAIISIVGLRGD